LNGQCGGNNYCCTSSVCGCAGGLICMRKDYTYSACIFTNIIILKKKNSILNLIYVLKKGLYSCPAGWECNNSSLLPVYAQCGGM
jgi:hypothetical protein